MKTNAEICHDFANSWKENERGGNIFYETDHTGARTLYSYGRHFAVAKIDGGNVFFTTRQYSVTTAKHISDARGALWGRELIFCPYPDGGKGVNFDAWEKSLKSTEKGLARARKTDKYTREIAHICAQVRTWCEATGETVPEFVRKYETIAQTATPSPEAIEAARVDRDNERRARIQREEWRREAKERREAQERARRLTQAERLEAWERGENVFLSWEDTADNVPLRVEARKGYKVVKTGKGVVVTIAAAREFYRALCAGEIHTGARVDTGAACYTVGEITPDTVRVGCHTWKRSYLDNFAHILETL